MSRRKRFHIYTWNGHVQLFFYIWIIRVTLFNTAWFWSKSKRRSVRANILGTVAKLALLTALVGTPVYAVYQHPYETLDVAISALRRLKTCLKSVTST